MEIVTEQEEHIEDDDRRRLESFLAARPEPETQEVRVASLGDTVVLRELTEAELEEWQRYWMPDGQQNRNRAMLDAQAALVAIAMESPRPSPQQITAAGYATLSDMVKDRFKPLEVVKLSEVVMDLSGGADDAVEIAGN
jgi:hypothetical protein